MDTVDPVLAGDVLLVRGIPHTVAGTATDAGGFYLRLVHSDLLLGWSLEPFKVLRQRSVDAPTTVAPTFYPDKPGFYKFELVVSDGQLFSVPAQVVVNALASALPRNCVPDLGFIFSFLSDFWNLVEDKEQIPVFWSGIAQVAASELFTLWQYEYSKSLRDVPRQIARRWLHYDLLLGEPIPDITKVRTLWGGVTGASMPVAGVAGVTGTMLVLVSPLFVEPITITVQAADPVTATTLALELRNKLQQADSRFGQRY